jgi:hypothetical protein
MKFYLYIFFAIILLLNSCSVNFYPQNSNLQKKGYMYYEIKKDSINDITEIKKYKKRIFSKNDRVIIKYINIDKNGNMRIIRFKNEQMNGWEIKYDTLGNKSKGDKFKKGQIVILKTPKMW